MEDGTGKVIVNPLERWVRTTTGALRPATLPLQDQPCDERAWRLLLALEDAAQRARIQCDVYTDTTGAMVRFQQGPFEVYVNVSAPQRILTENEWIPRIGKTTKLPCLTTSYLENFIETSPKASARVKRRALDYLCRRHPNRMDYVAQRAVLCHQQGALSLALKDLRRFFAFYSESKAPRELVKLYRKLSSHLSGR